MRMIQAQEAGVSSIFNEFINTSSPSLSNFKPSSNASTLWNKNRAVEASLNRNLGKLHSDLSHYLREQSVSAWGLASKKTDIVVANYVHGMPLAKATRDGLMDRNLDALAAFQRRRVGNMDLSERVWGVCDQAKVNMEYYLQSGIGTGRSANQISRDVRGLLQNPDKRFRRIRDPKTGKLKASRPMANYHPGQGVYRSSYQNALRMTRTETNMAYRFADQDRWQRMDFILGYEVKLSNSHPAYDICDSMVGKYPKTFSFGGWHPNCYCYTVPIMAKEKDLMDNLNSGTNIGGQVQSMPSMAKRYVAKRMNKIKKLKKKPYWLKEYNMDVDADILMGKAKQASEGVYSLSDDYAKRFGGVSTPVNLKGKGSMVRKARGELNGVADVKDAVRTTVIVPADKIDDVVAAITKEINAGRPPFTRIKIQTPDKFSGYQGVLTNIKTKNGILGEIQVNSPEMIFAKQGPSTAKKLIGEQRWNEIHKATGLDGGLGHKYYEEIRLLNHGIPAEARLIAELEKKSEAYYSHFRGTIGKSSKIVEKKIIPTAKPVPKPKAAPKPKPPAPPTRERILKEKKANLLELEKTKEFKAAAKWKTERDFALKEANRLATEANKLIVEINSQGTLGDVNMELILNKNKALAEYDIMAKRFTNAKKNLLKAEESLAPRIADILSITDSRPDLYFSTRAASGSYRMIDVPAKVQSGAESFARIIGGPKSETWDKIQVTFRNQRKRAGAHRSSATVFMGDGPAVVCHEMAHCAEFNSAIIKKATRDLLQKRCKGNALKVTHGREVAWYDEWPTPYTGRSYFGGKWNPLPEGTIFDIKYLPDDVGTEVFSMWWTELMQNPIGFMQKDPEFFDWGYDLILKLQGI